MGRNYLYKEKDYISYRRLMNIVVRSNSKISVRRIQKARQDLFHLVQKVGWGRRSEMYKRWKAETNGKET